MKNTFKRFKQFLLVPLWLLLAILQLVTASVYLATYWLRIILLKKDTKRKFSPPEQFLSRIFEASDLVIYDPEIKSEISTH